MNKVTERYFTTPEQGIEIITDAINAGWHHVNGATLKELKKDIKAVMKVNGTEQFFKYVYGVEEDSDTMTFSVFVKFDKVYSIAIK
jgi:hypothetical protein